MELLNKAYKFFWSIVETNDKKRMDKQMLPEGINAIVDIPYADDGKNEHLLDVYFPEGAEDKKLPVIIDIHGGGLMYAYKELNKNYCYNLAKRGFAVVNVSYSLAPDNKYPTCLRDVCAALDWVNGNMSKYFMNKEEIKKTITFEGIASSKEELNEYIKEKNIDKINLLKFNNKEKKYG